MLQSIEEIRARMAALYQSEAHTRKELTLLSEQYTTLLAYIKANHSKLDALEKERLALEASLKTAKRYKPRKSGRSSKSPKFSLHQALASLTPEDRKELFSKLSTLSDS